MRVRTRTGLSVCAAALLTSPCAYGQQAQSAQSSGPASASGTAPQTPPDPEHRNEAQGIMAPRATGLDAALDKYRLFGSARLRIESTDYFGSRKANGDYVYAGSLLRLGVRRETHTDDMLLELAVPTLYGPPTRAVAPSPQGALGQGASYFAANGSQAASIFPKQAYERFKNLGSPANTLQIGRFEFADGAETRSADSSLAYLKQNRIANRLISTNPFSYVGHSYDGLNFSSGTASHRLTAVAALPTRGSYDLKGADQLTNIKVAYLSSTTSGANQPVRSGTRGQDAGDTLPGQGSNRDAGAFESRLFGIFYEDTRGRQVVKVDNRPAAMRAKDNGAIDIGTIGGDDVRTWRFGAGKLDTLVWGAGQFGRWGELTQAAYAYDAEAGWQPQHARLNPWLRVGYYYGSGDGSGSNQVHGTFFPMLPSGRTYARFPFYASSNLTDAFAELVLRPSSKIVIRANARKLGLANRHDLYYSGSGAYDDSNFGFTGRSAGGSKDLGALFDTSLDYQSDRNTLFILYLGSAHGGSVIGSIYTGKDAVFAYMEIQKRF